MSLAPVLLAPDNFTPPARTPWGGRRIRSRYKPKLPADDGIVGESWEVSVDPSFPSRTVDGRALGEVIAADPGGWLGASERFGPQTPLLVKLLDAADNLSVQVHPEDGDPALGPGESGKPEAWVVLDADPGAGLYLGFRDGVGRADVAECLARGGALDRLMSFVPVAPGDAFVIDAGTPHAIGAGVTLLEPQIVRPGRTGVTYRFWDWNRRYDAAGRPDPAGAPRPLHVERSLAVTRWEGGAALLSRCRCPKPVEGAGLASARVVDWPWFTVERWSGSGERVVPAAGGLWAVTCLGGRMTIAGATGTIALGCGDSGVIPAAAGALSLVAEDALVFAVRTPSE